jgi:hypothetical protein
MQPDVSATLDVARNDGARPSDYATQRPRRAIRARRGRFVFGCGARGVWCTMTLGACADAEQEQPVGILTCPCITPETTMISLG